MKELSNRIKERLISFIEAKSLTKSGFEKMCGLSNGYINNFKGNLGSEKLEAILTAFPELSREWLLFGNGEMLVGEVPAKSHDLPVPSAVAGESVTIPREVFEQITKLTETVLSQQRTIEVLTNEIKKEAAPAVGAADCAAVG